MIENFLLSLLSLAIFLMLRTVKSFHMLQQNLYNDDNRYLKWIKNNLKKVFVEIDLLIVMFILLLMFVNEEYVMYLFSLFYFLIIYLYYKKNKKEQSKKPLVFTKRIKRLFITTMILYIFLTLLIVINYIPNRLLYYYFAIGILVYLNYFMVFLANVINKPVEKFVYYYYYNKASSKLKDMENLKVVGITGSYGKTSTKNILSDILNVKYDAYPTPKSFNTTYGMMMTINNYLDKFSEFFIAEMGAYKIGEIKDICNLVNPKYGILTKIGTAHLEIFGSQENIQIGKFELIESLPSDGVGILNGDDQLQRGYKLKNKCKIVWYGIDNKDCDIYASNIKLSAIGTTFDITFNDVTYPFETKLLGKANVYNILASVALAYTIGMDIQKIQLGVKKASAVEHRLELKKYGTINIIDDSYNSNPDGSKMALEVLSMMPGKKIVVTPGMIELGARQYELNKVFGSIIAGVCDEVILVGPEQTKPIYDGLKEAKYDMSKVHIINNVKEAFVLMQQLQENETYVLLENDLPDIFNEK
jgi:UDP-N-acetylmuramoyl-tripeptide--D-alanyl-D-alanine ligase